MRGPETGPISHGICRACFERELPGETYPAAKNPDEWRAAWGDPRALLASVKQAIKRRDLPGLVTALETIKGYRHQAYLTGETGTGSAWVAFYNLDRKATSMVPSSWWPALERLDSDAGPQRNPGDDELQKAQRSGDYDKVRRLLRRYHSEWWDSVHRAADEWNGWATNTVVPHEVAERMLAAARSASAGQFSDLVVGEVMQSRRGATNPGDDELRSLERAARAGDREALRRLRVERRRRGLPDPLRGKLTLARVGRRLGGVMGAQRDLAEIQAAYDAAAWAWTGLDWATDTDPDEAYLAEVQESADAARSAATQAVAHARRGEWPQAVRAAEEASYQESQYGDDPVWGPFLSVVERASDRASSGSRRRWNPRPRKGQCDRIFAWAIHQAERANSAPAVGDLVRYVRRYCGSAMAKRVEAVGDKHLADLGRGENPGRVSVAAARRHAASRGELAALDSQLRAYKKRHGRFPAGVTVS